MKRDPHDTAIEAALDESPEGNSDYGTYRDGADINEPHWHIMFARRSRLGQRARRLRRLASARRERMGR